MKILVATTRTQGEFPDDYQFAIPGELVQAKRLCAKGRADPDGLGCMCTRGFIGLNSQRATTTAEISEVPLSMADYVEAIRSSLEQQGFCEHLSGEAPEEAAELVALIAEFPVGTVVRRLKEWIDFEPPRAWSAG